MMKRVGVLILGIVILFALLDIDHGDFQKRSQVNDKGRER
jgi:hypothetical protein